MRGKNGKFFSPVPNDLGIIWNQKLICYSKYIGSSHLVVIIFTGLTSGDGTINYEEVLKLVEDNELALDAIHISQGQQQEAKDKPWRDSDGVEIGHMVEKLSGGW